MNKTPTLQFPLEMEPSWKVALGDELTQPYMQDLYLFLAKEKLHGATVLPPEPLILNAFWKTPLSKVKVVILGQDPYHGLGQAHGLSFSVPNGVPPPRSLNNIYKEMETDLAIPTPKHGCLNRWAEQGVLLLNTVLTVRKEEAFSHRKKGWERFTDRVIELLAKSPNPIVFLLWGNAAKDKCKTVLSQMAKNHLVLSAPHPSPLSAHQGFFGSRPFSQINAFLKAHSLEQVDWNP